MKILTEEQRGQLEIAASGDYLVVQTLAGKPQPGWFDELWLTLKYLEFIGGDDAKGRLHFRITPAGRAALAPETQARAPIGERE